MPGGRVTSVTVQQPSSIATKACRSNITVGQAGAGSNQPCVHAVNCCSAVPLICRQAMPSGMNNLLMRHASCLCSISVSITSAVATVDSVIMVSHNAVSSAARHNQAKTIWLGCYPAQEDSEDFTLLPHRCRAGWKLGSTGDKGVASSCAAAATDGACGCRGDRALVSVTSPPWPSLFVCCQPWRGSNRSRGTLCCCRQGCGC